MIVGKCIFHKGSIMSNGYGRIWQGDSHVPAHRIAYQKENGLIPQGFQIHHLCAIKLCINPQHLIALTRSDHQKAHIKRDGLKGITLIYSHATHCSKGHLLDGKNKRQRFCSTCKKQHQNEYTARNRELTNAKSNKWKQEHLEQHRLWNREYMRRKRATL